MYKKIKYQITLGHFH